MTKWQAGAGVYENPRDYEAIFNPGLQDLAFYRRVAAKAGGCALELGCGTGRLLWPLRQASLAVEGLDQSEAMLDCCRQNGHALGLSSVLHQGDWREFDLGRPFQSLLLPFNGLQHLTQAADVEAFRRDEGLVLSDVDYGLVPGLSNEVRAKLNAARPWTVGQASRIDGMTPAALGILAAYLRRKARCKTPAVG